MYDDLYARSLILESEGERFALLSLDLMAVEDAWAQELRRRVEVELGIPSHHVLIAATHTHSGTGQLMRFDGPLGPSLQALFLESEGPFDPVLYEYTLRRAFESLSNAAATVRPVVLTVGGDEAPGIASDRTGRHNSISSRLTAVGVADPATGEYLAAVLHFACHPTVLGDADFGISADFPGIASSIVESVFGPNTVALFLNGSLGDVSTRFTRRTSDYAESVRMGRTLAGAALKALSGPDLATVEGPVSASSRVVRLKPKPASWLGKPEARATELRAALEVAHASVQPSAVLRQLTTALQGAEIAGALRPTLQSLVDVPISIQFFRIGQLTFVAVPGELFSTLGRQIEEGAEPSICRVVGPANGYFGYLPDRKAFDEGGYEADASIVAPNAGEDLVAFVRNALGTTSGG